MTTSRSKAIGSEAERRIAAILGGTRVGMDGGPVDVIVGDYLAVQVKSLRTAPSLTAVIGMLEAIPQPIAEPPLRAVVVQTRPGAGRRSVRTITFLLDEWASWHGGDA
jgi:hypothetical protein